MDNKASIGIVLAVIAGIILLGVLFFVGSYNSLVSRDTTIEAKWGNVQSAYQRRADLIPNLVETVQGAREFEQQTLTQITALRSSILGAKNAVLAANTPEQLQVAGGQMDSALSRLMVIVENYPDLKANANYLALQSQLEGTENRIKYERDEYNTAVKDYKTSVRSFPSNIIAGMYGFNVDKWQTFKAEEGAEKPPQVKLTGGVK